MQCHFDKTGSGTIFGGESKYGSILETCGLVVVVEKCPYDTQREKGGL
jgi:hypothetical protein